MERFAWWLFALLGLLPMAASLLFALAYCLGLTGLLGQGPTILHFRELLGAPEIWRALAFSIWIAAATSIGTAALALFFTATLRSWLESGPLSYIVQLPLALPGTVAAFVIYQSLSNSGLFARLLFQVGMIQNPAQFPALVVDRFGIGILATHLLLAVPFFILLFEQLHRAERLDEFNELVQTLGGSICDFQFRVRILTLLHKAAPSLLLLFIAVLGSYEIPYLLGAQEPEMLSVLIMRKFALFDLSQKPQAYLAALLYSAIAIGVLAIGWRKCLLHVR